MFSYNQHIILAVLWVAYCTIHSVLADSFVKKFFADKLKHYFIYYRISYSIFAFISLAAVLHYQFSIKSLLLFLFPFQKFIAIFFMIPGLIIMGISIQKYFYELSGLMALQKADTKITLQQTGLHERIRHPLYSGTLLFVWSLFLFFPMLHNLIACIIMTIYVLIGIRLEEKKLILEYGDDYKIYRKNVPMLIPRFMNKKRQLNN